MRHTRAKLLIATALAAVIGGAAVGPFAGAGTGSASVIPAPLTFTLDPAVTPGVVQVGPVDGSRDPRDVGALAMPGGRTAELVLDEVIVHIKDQAELDAFLARWNGRVLDSFAPDAEGQDHLVKVDVTGADPADLPADLLATEPRQSGQYRAGDERVLRLLALAASEWKLGTELVIDWLTEPSTIQSGQAYEATDTPGNVFDWQYMRHGGAMDTGVVRAWQLLQAKGKLTPQVRYMVVDGGFSPNADFPAGTVIRKAGWGQTNPKDCTNGSACPWHGTDVALAALAKVDNGFGTAGPAGPVASHLIAVGNSLDYWTVLRRTEEMAVQEDPDVVNLSFTRDVNLGIGHARKWTDRRMRHVRGTGALIVTSSGNYKSSVDNGTLWVPCESTYVMCVGGMFSNATLATDSNYGQIDTPASVEIYGPMCVRSLNNPANPADLATREVCGTSVASPFVGGVAALVMAANPGLGPEDVRKILNETAHVGGLGATVTGSQRRVDALAAVARALGVAITAPQVVTHKPTAGASFGQNEWVDFAGTATDYMGNPLTITWSTSLQGKLGEGAALSVEPLAVGEHTILARATDVLGQTGETTVKVTVVDAPAQAKMVSPTAGAEIVEGNPVPLVATSVDPDTDGPVPDTQTQWEIRRNGLVIHTTSGHVASLPAGNVVPGNYTATFTAAGVPVQRAFVVTAVPAGQSKPTAIITAPAGHMSVTAYNGTPQAVSFTGTGDDAQDGALAGTRYRWIAYSGTETRVLCAGSAVPTGQPPTELGTYKNCAGFSAQFGLSDGDYGSTTWAVILEVFDSTGLIGTDSVNVHVNYTTG